MSTTPCTIAIVEDDSELRRMLVELLEETPEWEIVGAFPNAEAALEALLPTPPDVVLMDIQLPGISGIECTATLKARHPMLLVMVLTVYDNSNRLFDALAAGASGFLLKRDVHHRLKESIEDLLAGGSPISSSVAQMLVRHFVKEVPTLQGEDYNLTKREQVILDLLAAGMLYKEIADVTELTIHTVRFHLRNIYEKLHVRTRTEAVVKYLGR